MPLVDDFPSYSWYVGLNTTCDGTFRAFSDARISSAAWRPCAQTMRTTTATIFRIINFSHCVFSLRHGKKVSHWDIEKSRFHIRIHNSVANAQPAWGQVRKIESSNCNMHLEVRHECIIHLIDRIFLIVLRCRDRSWSSKITFRHFSTTAVAGKPTNANTLKIVRRIFR